MQERVPVSKIVETVSASVRHQGGRDTVRSVVASGLMSDVLTTDREEFLLVSNLSTPQVIRTADMVGAAAVLITNGKEITRDTLSLAKELDITLLSTELPLFESCCLLGRIIPSD